MSESQIQRPARDLGVAYAGGPHTQYPTDWSSRAIEVVPLYETRCRKLWASPETLFRLTISAR